MRYRALRPPYCYRWAGLVTVLVVVVSILISVFQTGIEDAPSAAPLAAHAEPSAVTEPSTPPQDPGLVRTTAKPGRFVALTFDDGPDPAYTPRILDALARHGAVATFCMVGTQARKHPELVREVVQRGMRLCDHTVSHDEDLSKRSEQRITAEIEGCWSDLQVAANADVPVDYFRAPGGAFSPPMRTVAAREGMKPLAWSVDSRDWTTPGTPQIVTTVQHALQPGGVVLLHDGGGNRTQTVDALDALLPWLTAQGYGFDFPA